MAASIPKAQVLIINQDTGVTVFKGASDSAGTFVAPEVAPGTYQVSVTATGLKQSVIRDLRATVAQVTSCERKPAAWRRHRDGHGRVQRRTRWTPPLPTISTLISPSDVQNLPLEQRTTENLLAFIPGVTHGGAANEVNTSQLSINGSRTLDNEVLLNGVSLVAGSHRDTPPPTVSRRDRFISSSNHERPGRVWPHFGRCDLGQQ